MENAPCCRTSQRSLESGGLINPHTSDLVPSTAPGPHNSVGTRRQKQVTVSEGFFNCGEVEDVVGVLTPVVGGVAQVFHDLLVELQRLLVAEVEEGEEEDRQEEGWEVESGVQGEEVAHMDGMWMTVTRRKELEPDVSMDDQGR